MRKRLPALSGLILFFALPGAVVPAGVAVEQAASGGPLAGRNDDCAAALVGVWTADLDVERMFDVRVTVDERTEGRFVARIGLGGQVEEVPARTRGDRIQFQPTSGPIAFDLRRADDGSALEGFIQYAGHLVHARIPRARDGSWTGAWNYLGPGVGRVRLDLYVAVEPDGTTGAYFFFRDPRLPSLFGEGVSCDGDVVRLRERNLGLRFEGRAEVTSDSLRLVVSALGGRAPIAFRRMASDEVPEIPDASVVPPRPGTGAPYVERSPAVADDGWATGKPSEVGLDPGRFAAMVRSIVEGEITATHAVLVARHGRLVVEEYFYGYDRETAHDLRSSSKTLASTLIGLAVRDGVLESASAPALDYLPYRRYGNWDPRKARITLHDLMTMSSGLDANDSDPSSRAAENAYQSQRANPDWVKLALDAPMIADPGAQPLYGGANPLILGGVLEAALDEPVEWFAHRTLFAPLGIVGYRWFTVPTGGPYLGGGLYLSPRDMLKIGQLYLDGGTWKGERILAEEWVRDSWGRYGRLAPLDRNGHEYGYLWWHHGYEVDGAVIETIEARGYGGQYIVVVPELDLVAVVTAGNYLNGRTRQSEEILHRFILPAVR